MNFRLFIYSLIRVLFCISKQSVREEEPLWAIWNKGLIRGSRHCAITAAGEEFSGRLLPFYLTVIWSHCQSALGKKAWPQRRREWRQTRTWKDILDPWSQTLSFIFSNLDSAGLLQKKQWDRFLEAEGDLVGDRVRACSPSCCLLPVRWAGRLATMFSNSRDTLYSPH